MSWYNWESCSILVKFWFSKNGIFSMHTALKSYPLAKVFAVFKVATDRAQRRRSIAIWTDQKKCTQIWRYVLYCFTVCFLQGFYFWLINIFCNYSGIYLKIFLRIVLANKVYEGNWLLKHIFENRPPSRFTCCKLVKQTIELFITSCIIINWKVFLCKYLRCLTSMQNMFKLIQCFAIIT